MQSSFPSFALKWGYSAGLIVELVLQMFDSKEQAMNTTVGLKSFQSRAISVLYPSGYTHVEVLIWIITIR